MDPLTRLQNARDQLAYARMNLLDVEDEAEAEGSVPPAVLARIRRHLSGGITVAEYHQTHRLAERFRESGLLDVADFIDSIAEAEKRQGLAQRDVRIAADELAASGAEYRRQPEVSRSDDTTPVNPFRVPGTGSRYWNGPRRPDDPYRAGAVRRPRVTELRERAIRWYERP